MIGTRLLPPWIYGFEVLSPHAWKQRMMAWLLTSPAHIGTDLAVARLCLPNKGIEMLMNRMTMVLIAVLLAGCNGDADRPSCLDRPGESTVSIASIDRAFSIMLNSDDRNARYSATLYLKTHLGDEMIKHYGNLLFKVSHPPGRIRIYESMGFFGGRASASLLAVYLQTEEETDAKAQIICSLGHIGPDAAQYAHLIEATNNAYARHYATRKSRGGSIVVRSGDAQWIIRADSIPPKRFALIAEESLRRIQATGQTR